MARITKKQTTLAKNVLAKRGMTMNTPIPELLVKLVKKWGEYALNELYTKDGVNHPSVDEFGNKIEEISKFPLFAAFVNDEMSHYDRAQ